MKRLSAVWLISAALVSVLTFAGRRISASGAAAFADIPASNLPVKVPDQKSGGQADDKKYDDMLNHLFFSFYNKPLKPQNRPDLIDRHRQDEGKHGIKTH